MKLERQHEGTAGLAVHLQTHELDGCALLWLSITLDSGATTELCVYSEPEVVALRRALLKAGVPEGDEGEEEAVLPASAPRSDE